ncbi:ABC transporter permease subunit [Nonomuraea sp. SYSU D8015]|uniref:ABC transporter permease subunit n=1 Tax=Nonomuraea sp. SYSU D8015 TaxID=2593644 RepID=UPI001CB752A6|nr:hypothetical protein [Nonomuraea sp. SYSU D8015]
MAHRHHFHLELDGYSVTVDADRHPGETELLVNGKVVGYERLHGRQHRSKTMLAAELPGDPPQPFSISLNRRYVIFACTVSGLVTGFAGILLAAQQQIGNPSVGLDHLLPAFVAALLGSTTIKPGRANPWGTLVAIAVLAIGLSGISQLGAEFWVTPLFNGITPLIAVGLAGYSARRWTRAAPARRRS